MGIKDNNADRTDGKNTYIELDKVLPGTKNFNEEYKKGKELNKKISSPKEKNELINDTRLDAAREQMAQLDDRIESDNFQ